jgi:hypothetical protein
VVYETPTPFLLTDVSLSWFYGTTPPACLGFVGGDTEIEKKDKLMAKVCTVSSDLEALEQTVDDIPAADSYIDRTIVVVTNVKLTDVTKVVREYANGDVMIKYTSTINSDIAALENIFTMLPLTFPNIVIGFFVQNGFNTPVPMNATTSGTAISTNSAIPIASYDKLLFYFTYKKQ